MSFHELLESSDAGVLATIKRDGRPHLSNVNYTYDRAAGTIRVSVTDHRQKTVNLRRDPRASFEVTTPDLGRYVVAECRAELSDVAADPNDAAVDALVDIYRKIAGEHPDWAEFRAAMVTDHRIALTLHVERLYGWPRD
ncbi:PPOX class probable F420-dependent enzyme [Asanoa hainanensis]|uniref:PPOX class probable F420-dependent enzyme n=1 Tax=Asanoa hainanensis TaxID=560556 RepID=A0A239PDW1_9ACTN|nr:PPOX class F420-dependent oxidoreductase [Asanoa hainanensis]SNT65143.1 PPOX class probable F420-dependent enzyme [Asanoa hainanensis]